MSVAQQAIAARRKAKTDPRYIKQARKDAIRRALRYKAAVQAEMERKQRKKK